MSSNDFSLHITCVCGSYSYCYSTYTHRLYILTTGRHRPNETRNIKLRIICFYSYIYVYLTLDIKQLPSSFKNKFHRSHNTQHYNIIVWLVYSKAIFQSASLLYDNNMLPVVIMIIQELTTFPWKRKV